MSKISLVARRKDKHFDTPTVALERAAFRLREADRNVASESFHGSPSVRGTAPQPRTAPFKKTSSLPNELELGCAEQAALRREFENLLGEDDNKELRLELKRVEAKGQPAKFVIQISPKQDDRLLSARQLATRLAMSSGTIIKLAKRGSIKGYKIGRHWRFNYHEVLQDLKITHNKAPKQDEE